jgi:transcription elongation GreA/GreB family factor
MIKKSKLHEACMAELEFKLKELQEAIAKVHESVIGEQNSTAGNKFETARAMGQEELDRLNRQLNNSIKEMNILSQIEPDKECKTAQLGALIETDKKKLYLCIGLGKIELDKDIVFAVSSISPIGQALMGKSKGDEVVFAGKTEKIVSVR